MGLCARIPHRTTNKTQSHGQRDGSLRVGGNGTCHCWHRDKHDDKQFLLGNCAQRLRSSTLRVRGNHQYWRIRRWCWRTRRCRLIGSDIDAANHPVLHGNRGSGITPARSDGGLVPSSNEVCWTGSSLLIGSGNADGWTLRPALCSLSVSAPIGVVLPSAPQLPRSLRREYSVAGPHR